MNINNYSSLRRKKFDKSFFYSWTMILVYLLIGINVILMIAVPDIYFAFGSLQTIIRSGMDLAIMVLGMTLILVLGEIDVSVASTMILSAMIIGLCYQAGVPAFVSVLLGVMAGAVCGLLNGVLVAVLNMPSVIVTIATSMLYRGIVRAVLKDAFLDKFPSSFSTLAWNDIGGVIPVSMIMFIAFAIIFAVLLHKSKFGRELYIIGNSKDVANYSGIRVNQKRIIAFVIMGATAAISSIFFVGRLGGITYSMGAGYDLKVIAIVVLGGVSTLGGKGKIYGPVISTFFMAFLAKSLDLFEVHPNVQKIAIGVVLILAVLIPRLNKETFLKIKLRIRSKEIARLESEDVSYNVEKIKQQLFKTESKKYNSDSFLTYIKQLQITSSSMNINELLKKYYDAKNDYLTIKNDYRQNGRTMDLKQKLEEKSKKYQLEKNELSFYYDVQDELLRTQLLLIRLNYDFVNKEIINNATEFYSNLIAENKIGNDVINSINKLELTYWNVSNKTEAKVFASLFKKRISSFFKANPIYAKRKKIELYQLRSDSNNLYLQYVFQKYQNKIYKDIINEKNNLLRCYKKMLAKKGELSHEEK